MIARQPMSDGQIILAVVILGVMAILASILTSCAAIPQPPATGTSTTSTTTIASTTSTTTTTLPPAPAAVRRACVIVGIAMTTTGVACPGADVDAQTVERWVVGRPTTMLMDGRATRAAIETAIRARAAGFGPNDLLTVAVSGHGTQRRDTSGDEADGEDEGIVCGDEEVWWDDDVWRFLCSLPPCRVELITDTCHAEGNWRRIGRKLLPRAIEPELRAVQLELALEDVRGPTWGGRIAQWAGCPEGGYSYGGDDGGTLTQTMDKTRKPGITRYAWHQATKLIMPDHQQPVYTEHGDSMAEGVALQ